MQSIIPGVAFGNNFPQSQQHLDGGGWWNQSESAARTYNQLANTTLNTIHSIHSLGPQHTAHRGQLGNIMMLQEIYLDSHTYEQLADTILNTMHYIHSQGLWHTKETS